MDLFETDMMEIEDGEKPTLELHSNFEQILRNTHFITSGYTGQALEAQSLHILQEESKKSRFSKI